MDPNYVNPQFVELMNEVLAHGYAKHGPNSFQYQAERGQLSRNDERKQSEMIMHHAKMHCVAYVHNEHHDHFHDLEHQLAAIAVNAMMEYVYYIHEKNIA